MKRPISGIVVALVVLVVALFPYLPSHVHAAPPAQDIKPVIAQPESDATVRGLVQIVGTAVHPQFQRYELYYAPYPVPADNAWIFIGPDAHFQQQPLGLLGNWDSRAVPDGTYALRVRVVKQDANYIDSEPRKVTVANTKAPESPTPEVTPTSQESPTPEGPTATFAPPTAAVVATVPPSSRATISVTQAAAAASGSATPTPILASADAGPSLISTAGEALQPSRLAHTARTAAEYTVLAFVVLGLFFGVKALLAWLWQKARP